MMDEYDEWQHCWLASHIKPTFPHIELSDWRIKIKKEISLVFGEEEGH